jgi:hypothetical protein
LIDLINKMAKALGLGQIVNDTDVAAIKKLAGDVANSLTTGRDISEVVGAENVKEYNASIPDTKQAFNNKNVQARFSTDYFEDSNDFTKLEEDGFIVHNSNINDFNGETVVIHNPDSFASGNIKFRDKDLVKGEGGVYFVLMFGDVWASSKAETANQMAGLINTSLKESTDGKARVVLVKGDPSKNLTSVKGAKALMGVMEILADDGLIPLSAFRKALTAAGKKYGVEFDGRSDAKSIHKDIQDKFMNVSNSSFEKRGDFVKDVIDEIAKQDVLSKDDIAKIAESIGAKRKMTKFSKASIIDSVSFATTERMLRDVPNSHAYAVIETSSPVTIKEDGRHESYPWHIVTEDGSRPKIYILNERPYFNDAFIAAKNTEKVKAGERFEDVSRAGLAQRGMGLAKIDMREPSKVQASKGGRNLVADAGLNKEMTSDDQGNYVFYHYSGSKIKSIDPKKFGKNLATGKDERPGVGISMYYTRPDIKEANVPSEFGYVVRIPENQVYPFNEDPLDLLPEAEKQFKKQYPGQAFDFNKQVGFVTKVAADRGYPMTVAEWNIKGRKVLRAQTTEAIKPEVYQEKVFQDGYQVTKTTSELEFKPNAKRRQASVGGRDLDQRLKNFVDGERAKGTSDADIERAIRNRFPLIDQQRMNTIMGMPTVAEPTPEEKLATVVQPEGEERTRGMEKRFGDLDEDTARKIEDEAKTYFAQTNKQTEKAAEEFMKGKPVEYMADYVVSNPNIPGAVNVWMAATTAKNLGKEIEAAKKAGDMNRVETLSTMRANIYNHFASKATEIGQTIQAFVSFKDDPAANQFMFNKILKQLEDKGVTGLSDAQKVEIKKMLDDVSTAAAGLPKDMAITKLSHYLGKLTPISAFDIMQAMWYAKILSGITTQSKNFFANMVNTFIEVPVVAMRMSVQTGSLQPIFYAMKGLGGGTLKGLVKAGDILKSGVTSKSEDKFFNNDNLLEYFTWSDTKIGKGFGGAVGKILDFPLFFETSPRALKFVGRSLTASDALFSTANQEAVANMLAFAQAKQEGLKGNVYNRVQQILNNTKQSVVDAKAQATQEGFKPGTVQHKRRVIEIVNQKRGEEIVAKAEEMGKRATLTNEPEGFTRGIYLMATKIQETMPISKVMIPFTRIVANVSEMMINFSPAGTYRAVTGIKNPKFSFKFTPSGDNKLTKDQRADLFIKSMIGITTLTVLANNIGDEEDDWFDITAGGPTDFAKKYELMKGGWRPYTITMKDGTKISYAEWPIAGALSALGTVLDVDRYGNVEDLEWIDKMVVGASGYMSAIYDKSLLKGISDFVDIFRPTGKYGAGSDDFIKRTVENTTKFGAQQAKAITLSNFSQQALKLTDEYKDNPIKEAKGAEVFYRDIPLINDGLNPIVDVFGDPVTYATTERLLPWMSVSDEKKDQVLAYLNRNNVFVGMAKERTMINLDNGEERKMTRQELYEYRKLAGKYTKDFLYENISTLKDINGMENGKEMMKQVVSDFTSAARDRAYAEILTK